MTGPGTPVIQRAPAELIALAVATRVDWREHDVSGTITAAASAGMTWEQVLVNLPRLMADPSMQPRHLVPDSRNPLRKSPGVPPERNALYAAEARAGIERKIAELRDRGTEGSEVA